VAFTDWLACAWRGREEPAARAAGEAGEAVAWLAAAGHVLDFDDTYLPGIVHASAPTAPAALIAGAEAHVTMDVVLRAHAAGFEAAAALARANHPALYDRGLHPTAVCGTVGAAVAAATAFGLDAERTHAAVALAGLRSTGSRAGFGTDGKALGVGLAAADGVQAARLAHAGARAPASAADAFGHTAAARWAEPDEGRPAVTDNWIKPWPCCLMTHSAIEAALAVRAAGADAGAPLVVRVHPRARQAAAYDDPTEPLQGKFSIGYLTAFTLARGAPDVDGLAALDDMVRRDAAARIAVREDAALGEAEARIESPDGTVLARVEHALGSPQRPLDPGALVAKVTGLAGHELDGAVEPRAHAAEVLHHLA
jgi:2-methylcitrate dehydratase PrpD